MSTVKANQYLQALDVARCSGDWDQVPEWTRKVLKHAPGRKCLALTALTECKLRQLRRPSPGSTSPTIASYGASLSVLQDALQEELSSYTIPLPRLPAPAGGGHSSIATEDDLLQARVVIACIWILKEGWAEVLDVIPGENEIGEGYIESPGGQSDYMGTVRIKALVLKGIALSHIHPDHSLPLQVYRTATRLPSSFRSTQRNMPSFMSWLEKALARYSIATYRVWLEEHPPPATPVPVTAPSSPDFGYRDGDSEEVDGSDVEEAVGVAIGNTIVDESTVASAFRNFHSFVAGITQETRSAISGKAPKNLTSEKEAERREVYKYYFKFLSLLLLPPSHPERPVPKHLVPSQNGGKETISMVASAGPRKTTTSKAGTPKQLREELREISAVYQKLLLASLKFPKADEYCEPVGEWIDQVVENWRTAGGSAEDAAPVVEILYKAAQNTFHSPRVLRHLFYTLYATGNFVDALAALNTYVELVEKAKERLAKGSEEKDFDSDKLIIQTVVEGVRVLCKFTGNPQKAMELAEKMEKWVEEWRIKERETLAEAYRGIGMANAAYARQTPEAELRPDAQKAAVEAFKKALTYGPIDAQSWYGLALMGAEMRKVDEAMESTRRGLGALKYNFVDNEDPDDAEGNARDYKRYAVPLLHLLALLMTTREDFENAEKVCKNAFDIVGEGREAVEDLGVNDKVAIFELMMTQLAIVEAVEDSEAAIPIADHLLGLYSMLFDSTYLVQRLEAGNSDDTPMGSNPSSRPTTTASRRSRFFNRGHKKQFSASYTSLPPQAAGQESPPSRGASVKKQRPKSGHQVLGMTGLPDQAGSTPRIHVTDVNGGATTPEKVPRKMRPVSISGGTIRRMRSLGSMRLKQRQDEPPTPPLPASTEASSLEFSPSSSVREVGKNPHLFHTLKNKLHHHQLHNGHNGASASDTSISLEKFPSDMGVELGRESIKPEDIPHNLPRNKLPHPLGALGRTMSDDGQNGRTTSIRRPFQLPEPKLAVDEERRQVLGALRGAWICVAGLYGRAGYFEDAHMATDEANSLIQKDGDGEADVLAARGALAFTQGRKALAAELFEQALAIDYDHPETIVGLSKILLKVDDMDSPPESSRRAIERPDEVSAPEGEKDEADLDKAASRNRALGLLEKLVASARGWDLPDAWYLLADALDKSGETELAKSALWRVVELEDGTGVRKWRSCGIGVV